MGLFLFRIGDSAILIVVFLLSCGASGQKGIHGQYLALLYSFGRYPGFLTPYAVGSIITENPFPKRRIVLQIHGTGPEGGLSVAD